MFCGGNRGLEEKDIPESPDKLPQTKLTQSCYLPIATKWGAGGRMVQTSHSAKAPR